MGLQENFEKEAVGNLNLRDAITVTPDVTLREAIQRMQKAQIGCVIVVNSEGEAVGAYNEAMLRNQLTSQSEFLEQPISEYMATKFPWALKSDSVGILLDAMQANNTRFVVVLDEDKKVCGLTGQKGLMEFIAEHFPKEVMVQNVGNKKLNSEREGA